MFKREIFDIDFFEFVYKEKNRNIQFSTGNMFQFFNLDIQYV